MRSALRPMMRFIDIAANLTDSMYEGSYHGSKKHEADLDQVLERSWKSGLDKIIITGVSLEESRSAVKLSRTNDKLFCTVGCHPTHCQEIENFSDGSESYLSQLLELVMENPEKVVALGELGLDYDRLQFCSKDIQLKHLESQLDLLKECNLPLFLHCRNSAQDLLKILQARRDSLIGGVVHSFDGSADEAKEFIDLGYYIGLNGCSLKTAENLDTVKTLPSESILIETDCPWCDIRPSHASSKLLPTGEKFELFPAVKKEKWKPDAMVKGRNEPCNIVNVLKVIAKARDEDVDLLAETVYKNSMNLFFSK